MTDPTSPSADILNERLKHLGSRFDGVERRIDGLATKDELRSLITAKDELMSAQVVNLMEDIRNLTASLATEQERRIAGDKENEHRSNTARTYALSALGLFISALLALIVLINQIGGTPT